MLLAIRNNIAPRRAAASARRLHPASATAAAAEVTPVRCMPGSTSMNTVSAALARQRRDIVGMIDHDRQRDPRRQRLKPGDRLRRHHRRGEMDIADPLAPPAPRPRQFGAAYPHRPRRDLPPRDLAALVRLGVRPAAPCPRAAANSAIAAMLRSIAARVDDQAPGWAGRVAGRAGGACGRHSVSIDARTCQHARRC